MSTASPTARRPASAALNHSARRIWQAAGQAEWNTAVVDGALEFAARAALFLVQGGAGLRLERSAPGAAPELTVPLGEARALHDAVESREPVVAAWTAAEFSQPVFAALSELGFARRAYLFPIVVTRGGGEQRAVAVLAAAAGESDALDGAALELVCLVAGAAWQARLTQPPRDQRTAAASTPLIGIAGVSLPAPAAPIDESDEPNQELHQRARRYAAVKVAEWRLYGAARVARGRAEAKLYDLFQEEIDRERARFRAVFLEKDPTMVDYLHEEMIRTLAQNRAGQMGENYPGAMYQT